MLSSDSSRDVLLEQLAAEFVERHRRGEGPVLSEYAQRHPDLAGDIRELFPALVQLEQFKPLDATGPFEPRPAAADRIVLERLGDYRIMREVGRGGMGVVYEAEQESLGRHVALKVLPGSALLNPTYLERFRCEAKAAARLHHTNIVPVFGVGECDGVHYYAMQFIQGESLDRVLLDLRRLRKAHGVPSMAEASAAHSLLTGRFAPPTEAPAESPPPPPAKAANAARGSSTLSARGSEDQYFHSIARVAMQVADALAYAHRQGILHRDIKPSNLLLDQQGTVWVTDFGLAKAEGADDLTQTGDIVGTVRFMAPERFDGRSLPQSDVYALGVTMYELLTLRPAFDDANKAKLIDKVLHEQPPPPRKLEGSIPRDLETVVLKCLAKDPAERYPSADTLAEDLRRFLADRPIKARRTPWYERTWRWCRRNPGVASLSTGLLLLLTITAVGGAVMSLRLADALGQARDDRDRAQDAEHAGERKLFESYVSEANATRSSGRPGQRFGTLRRIRNALEVARAIGMSDKDRLRLRNIAIAALCLPDVEEGPTFNGAAGQPLPDKLDLGFRRRVLAAQAVDRLLAPEQRVYGERWFSPDGRFVAVYKKDSGGSARVWRIDGRKPILVAEDAKGPQWVATVFAPDSRRVAFGHGDGSVDLYDTTTGRRQHLEPGPGQVWSLAFHPHLPRLAVASGSEVAIWDLPTGRRLRCFQHSQRVSSVAWHPRGHRLLTGCWITTEIHLWDVASGRELTAPWLGHRNLDGPWLAFAHGGDRVVSNDWDHVLRLWDAATGRLLLSMPTSCELRFSADDRSLGPRQSGDAYDALHVAGGQEMRALSRPTPAGSERFLGYSLHPGGRLLAASTKTGIGFFDLFSQEELAFVRGSFTELLRFDQTGALWTSGSAGLLRWPVQVSAAAPRRFRIGPPEWIANLDRDAFAVSDDGRVAAVPLSSQEVLVIHRGPPRRILRLGPQIDVRYVRVSPDGRRVITGTHHFDPAVGFRYKVWDAGSGRLVANLPLSEVFQVHGFSPDSRWLYVGGKVDQRLEVASLSSRHVEPGAAPGELPKGRSEPMRQGGTISPDNVLAAFGQSDGSIQLVLTSKANEEIARLRSPEVARIQPSFFSPDGSLLLATGEETGTCYVFDLRRIREQLTELDLDWAAPPYRPANPEATRPALDPPLQVELIGAAAAASGASMAAHESQLAVAQLFFNPFDAEAHYRLGERLLEAGKWQPAYAHLSAALAFRPNLDAALLPRALAAYRLGRWADAAEYASRCLEKWDFNFTALEIRALAQMQRKQYQDAVNDLSRVIARESGWPWLYQWRARCYQALGKRDLAKADREQLLKVGHNDPTTLNNEAWYLLTGPVDLRDPKTALKMIHIAVVKQPGNAVFLNTLGVAEYRHGRYRDAVVTLEKSRAAGNRKSEGFNLFFLAMCHARLGDPTRAKDCFDQAVKWTAAQKNLTAQQVEELKAFRAEAEELLHKAPSPRPRSQ